jgi:penicillin-binding protein A
MFQKQPRHNKTSAWLVVPSLIMAGISIFFFYTSKPEPEKPKTDLKADVLESRRVISKVVSEQITNNLYPAEITVAQGETPAAKYKINYTLRADLQDQAENLLNRYRPDYGAIVMLNARTGEVLAMSSFEKSNLIGSNLALKATYPAASIFKVITASTAVDKAGINPDHRIAFNGGNYTLYKKNVLSEKITRWTRFITLKDAFARSINTAFGRLSLESFEPQDLSDYADKFYFNHEIPADFAIETSQATVPAEKGYALTEVASGYNRFNTMSPVHGAMIASAIINNGEMPIPYIVKNVTNDKNENIYTGSSVTNGQIIKTTSAEKVQQMMEQTVLTGTSRKTFRQLVRDRNFKEVEMGGKTGHFSGTFPQGRTDWFVGYASDGDDKIAIAAITVNVKNWTVKSSALGEMMFRKYFKTKIDERETAISDNNDVDAEKVEKVERKSHRSKKRRS